MRTVLLGAVLVTLALAACDSGASSNTTVADTEPTPIFGVIEIGGCNMLGLNCITRVLWTDGKVTAYRSPLIELSLEGLAGLTPEVVDRVDPGVPVAVAAAIAGADIEAVMSGLPPGTCYACVDGVDFILLLATSNGDVRIDSAETALDPRVPLIAELNNAAVAMGRQTVLPILGR